MNYNRFRRLFIAPAVLAASVMALASCTTVDDTIGSNLVPDNQQMKAGYLTLPGKGELNPKKYVETRLFQTDSVVSSNLGYGYMGSELNDTIGLRSAGFLSQYTCYYKVDSGYFGYKPIFDSAQMLFSIKGYGQDTVTPQKYYVYEITDNKYLTTKPEADTTFYLSFDPIKAGIVSSEPVFSFTFPNPKEKGPSTTTAVTVDLESGGKDFISRLMLQSGNYHKDGKSDYSIYSLDSLAQWVEEFKGLYIRPAVDQSTKGKGGLYATDLEASGFAVFGRNKVKDDPSLIQDTIGMVYYFYDSYIEGSYGKVSVNTLHRDYAQATSPARVMIDNAKETNTNRPTNNLVYVEGMSGVVSEMTFTQEFFDTLEAEIAKENEKGTQFKDLAFSQVRMSIYFSGSNYDWTQIDPVSPGKLVEEMNSAQNRLGLYTNFKTLSPIIDYPYSYEKNYGTELSYGGTITRSRGCYVMNITAYMQTLWNDYSKEKAAAQAEGRAIDLTKVAKRTIYLAPEAYGLFSTALTVAQGMPTETGAAAQNHAPIRFEFTYNMIK